MDRSIDRSARSIDKGAANRPSIDPRACRNDSIAATEEHVEKIKPTARQPSALSLFPVIATTIFLLRALRAVRPQKNSGRWGHRNAAAWTDLFRPSRSERERERSID